MSVGAESRSVESKTRQDKVIPLFGRVDPALTETALPQSLLELDPVEFEGRLKAMIKEATYESIFEMFSGTPPEVDDAFDDVVYLGEPDVVPKEAARDLRKAYEIEDRSNLISFDSYWDE